VVNALIEAELGGGETPIITPPSAVTVNSYLGFTTVIQGVGLPVRVYYIFPPVAQRNRVAQLTFSPEGLMMETVVDILGTVRFLE
jgi:hypothetical protein